MTISFPLPAALVDTAVAAALAEDLGDAGDITTRATIPRDAQGKAIIQARKEGVVAGTEIAVAVFCFVDPSLQADVNLHDGAPVKPGDTIISLNGPSRTILSAERVALNFLGHLSGVATATHDLVNAVRGTDTKIVCTRKTLPGLRGFQKHAVRCGGGFNHRFGLYDAVMIKDNHIAACGGITGALKAAKATLGHTVKIEIEVDTLKQLAEALSEGADIIMLDNMDTDTLKKAVGIAKGKAVLEASGNITVENVRAIAETGVDVISSGWITHSAPNLDLGLEYLD